MQWHRAFSSRQVEVVRRNGMERKSNFSLKLQFFSRSRTSQSIRQDRVTCVCVRVWKRWAFKQVVV